MSLDTRNDARLALARSCFPEIRFEDLEVTQVGPDRWKFVERATGVEYRLVEAQLHQSSTGNMGIAAFTVDAAGVVHFLRRRGGESLG
jgi:hypothetical protein